MKKVLLISILVSLLMACNAQDVCTYSKKYVDSLKTIIAVKDTQINQQLNFINAQGLKISKYDSLFNVKNTFENCDSLVFFKDTLSVSINSNNVLLNITKKGTICFATIIKGKDVLTIKKED